jgi:hypothetical protein
VVRMPFIDPDKEIPKARVLAESGPR